ncbi:unnamed protein product [Prunus brigantina]
MPDEIKMETNYNLEDLGKESLAYVNRLFAERYKQLTSDLHHHFEVFDNPQGVSKFPQIDVFGDVYVRHGNELAESLHVNDDVGDEPVGSSGVRLPTSSRDSDRVFPAVPRTVGHSSPEF